MQYDMEQVINRALHKKGTALVELCQIIITSKLSVHYLLCSSRMG